MARVPPGPAGEPFARLPPGRRLAGEAEKREIARGLLAGAPDPAAIWVFAYGSLIWKPAFEPAECRTGLARGYRRRFCLGWDRFFRGCEERPGLMLALDRGGQCRGLACRMPPGREEEAMTALVNREMRVLPHPFPPRWIPAETEAGRIHALAFVIDRASDSYVDGLSEAETADILATAAGPAGSMADYLFATVAHLEERGIRDRALWRLQEMVAARLEAMPQPR